MKPRLSYVTLAVSHMDRSLKFYRDGLGLPTNGIVGGEFRDEVSGAAGSVVIFEMQNGVMLILYPRSDLAKDAGTAEDGPSSTEFSLGHVVRSKEEVDGVLAQATAAGAVVPEPPRMRPWGVYSGYFKDPDGHLWEITWDPRLTIPD